MTDWVDPAWRAEADGWIDEQLRLLGVPRVGDTDQFHVRPWATVMRIPTGDGDLYFKVNAAPYRHEAALVERLSARRPDCVPPLLAVDVDRGWMLMADAGTRLREIVVSERTLTPWLEILPLYAGLQVDLIADADELVARGVPDRRLAVLVPQLEEVLDTADGLRADLRSRLTAALPQIADLAYELGAFGLPETVQHDDLHDAQVFVRDGSYRVLDWGDACVSHPFFSLAVTLDGVIAWGLDDIAGSVDTTPFLEAYLAPFERIAGGADLVTASTTARRLGWICRAVNGHLAGAEPIEKTEARLQMFLDDPHGNGVGW